MTFTEYSLCATSTELGVLRGISMIPNLLQLKKQDQSVRELVKDHTTNKAESCDVTQGLSLLSRVHISPHCTPTFYCSVLDTAPAADR